MLYSIDMFPTCGNIMYEFGNGLSWVMGKHLLFMVQDAHHLTSRFLNISHYYLNRNDQICIKNLICCSCRMSPLWHRLIPPTRKNKIIKITYI